MQEKEIEAKIPVSQIQPILVKAKEMNLKCIQDHSHEYNIRLDLPERKLEKNHQVLRLRSDSSGYTLTYKSTITNTNGIAEREEIETKVENFEKTHKILLNLGYEDAFVYEKYRSIFILDQTKIMADHTPIGDFVEIEGENAKEIHAAAEKLGLDWHTSTTKSYQTLYKEWAVSHQITPKNMVF